MQCIRVIPTAALLMVLSSTSWAQETKTLLDRAIQAAGGEATLKKFPALTLKGKGKIMIQGKEVPFRAEWQTQGKDQGRTLTDFGATVELKVVNKTKGWSKEDKSAAEAMDKETLAEELETLYFNYVTTLAPLKEKGFKLSALPEEKVEGKPAVGLLVTHKQHRDVRLWFDKESALLVKSERMIKESGQESAEEVLFSNYQEVSGMKVATKFVVRSGGKLVAEAEMTEIKPLAKLDAKVFEKP